MEFLNRDLEGIWADITKSAADFHKRLSEEEITPLHVEEVGLALVAILLVTLMSGSAVVSSTVNQSAALALAQPIAQPADSEIVTPVDISIQETVSEAPAPTAPASSSFITPEPGSILSSSATFTWQPVSSVSEWALSIGSTPGALDITKQYADGTSVTVSSIPQDGRTLYLRLWGNVYGEWKYRDYTYVTREQTVTTPTNTKSSFITPEPGSILSSSATFTWQPVSSVSEWALSIGSTPGALDITKQYADGTSVTVSSIPQDGRTLYLRLWGNVYGEWKYRDYTYKADQDAYSGPAISSPATIQPPAVCSDSLDNDGDTLIDYPNDPGCTSPTDMDETNVSPDADIKVYSPNGGETLRQGDRYTIKWYAQERFSKVNIYLLKDRTMTYPSIASEISNSGSYVWTVPNTMSGTGFQVMVAAVGAHPDDSDSSFTIQPSTTVTYPKGGENMVTGDQMLIRWTPTIPISVIEIVSTDGNYSFGIYGPKYGNTSPITSGEYNYSVVNTIPAGTYYVRITPADGSAQAVSKTITINQINQPSITVLSPNGGEVWPIGTQQTIKWSSNNVSSSATVDILISDKNQMGLFVATVPNTGSYSWLVPRVSAMDSPQPRYYVELKSMPCNSQGVCALVQDQSNAPFSVTEPWYTPQFDSMTPTSGTSGTVVTISGQHFYQVTPASGYPSTRVVLTASTPANYFTTTLIPTFISSQTLKFAVPKELASFPSFQVALETTYEPGGIPDRTAPKTFTVVNPPVQATVYIIGRINGEKITESQNGTCSSTLSTPLGKSVGNCIRAVTSISVPNECTTTGTDGAAVLLSLASPSCGSTLKALVAGTYSLLWSGGHPLGADTSKVPVIVNPYTPVLTAGGSLTFYLDFQPKPVTTGSLFIANNYFSPSIGVGGETNRVVIVAKLRASGEPVTLTRVALSLGSGNATVNDITQVTLWDGSTKVGTGFFIGTNRTTTVVLTTPVLIPKDVEKNLAVNVDLAPIGVSQPVTESGHFLTLGIIGSGSQGVGVNSGNTIIPTGDALSSGIRIFKSYPVFSQDWLPSTGVADGRLLRFKISASNAGPVSVGRLDLMPQLSSFGTINNLGVYAYTDSAYSIPVSGYGTYGKINGFGYSTATSSIALRINVTSPAGFYLPLVIPEGQTRYIEIRGSFAQNPSWASMTLMGDSSFEGPTSLYNSVFGPSKLLWSPNSTTTAQPATLDWFNSYALPGLPTAGLMQVRTN